MISSQLKMNCTSRDALSTIFNETGEDEDFLGFSEIDLKESKLNHCSSPILDQDFDSRSSGYHSNKDSSSENDDESFSDSDVEDVLNKDVANKRNSLVKQRKALLNDLMADLHNEPLFQQMKSNIPASLHAPRRGKSTRNLYSRFLTRSLPPVTRRRSKLGEIVDDEPVEKKRLIVQLFPRKRKPDGESPKKRSYARNSRPVVEHEIIPVEDVTERMLNNIAAHSVGKTYDPANGTSCHQCRQKTTDTKSCCRSKLCVGVRGQFCGPCLQNRYGESVKEALLDPEWICPVCKGFCNCSICRNRHGKCATGILIGLARHYGYTNVKDYLAGLKSEQDSDSEII